MNEKTLVRHGEKLIRFAQSAGATDAQCVVSFSEGEDVAVRKGVVENISRESSQSLRIYVLVGQREGVSSCESFANDDLKRTAEEAVAIAKASTENPFASLATPDMWPCAPSELSKKYRALDMFDGTGFVSVSRMKKEALHLERLLLAESGVTQTEMVQIGQSQTHQAICSSRGFIGVEFETGFSKYASGVAEAKNREMNSGGDFHSAIHRSDLRKSEEVARRAGERARALLGATSIPTARLPVIFSSDISPRLLQALFAAIGGGAVYDKTSFLLDKLLKCVFRPGISVVDDPFIPRGFGSGLYDNDTVRRDRRAIIDDGVLTTWTTSIESGAKLKLPSTGHAGGPSNVTLSRGAQTLEELIASIPRGLLVTELMGHGPNIVTGDYSSGAAGLLIEHGEVTRPVNEVTIAGNLLEMFRTLIPASDMSDHSRMNAPSCLIPEMTVAGH